MGRTSSTERMMVLIEKKITNNYFFQNKAIEVFVVDDDHLRDHPRHHEVFVVAFCRFHHGECVTNYNGTNIFNRTNDGTNRKKITNNYFFQNKAIEVFVVDDDHLRDHPRHHEVFVVAFCRF
jgi:ADP-ribose pyrophosphatase YjhB (NUDIX family)